MSAGLEDNAPGLVWRALQFGAIFGIAPGGLLGLELYRAAGGGPHLPALPKVIAVAAGAAAILLLLTGGRWNAIFSGLGGFAALLMLGWIALALFLPRLGKTRA